MSTDSAVEADGPAPQAPSPAPRKRRPLWWRILRVVLIILLVLIVGVVAYVGYLFWRVPSDHLDPVRPGALSVPIEPPAPLTVGPYRVSVTGGDQAAVTVTTGDGALVWRNAPGTAFLGAGSGSVSWTEKFGYFWADVARTATLTDQSIDSVRPEGEAVAISGTLSGGGRSAAYTVTLAPKVKSPTTTVLGMSVDVQLTSDGAVSSVVITSGLDPDEQVHGFGEQFRDFNLVGTTFPVLVQEQGIGRGEQPITFLADITNWAGANLGTTYAPWPTYVTGGNRSFALTDTESSGGFGIADLSRAGQVSLETWSDSLSAEVTAADSPTALLAARSAGTTYPPLAAWSQDGAILGLQGGTEKVRTVVDQMQAAGAKISGVWLQDWVGKRQTSFGSQLWWTWQLDPAQYPGWDQMVADFNARGIEVLTYVNPFLANAADKGPGIRNLYTEAEAKGYLVKNEQGGTYVVETVGFPVALMDLTNPDAREWYAQVIADDVLGAGARGFMADFGEGLPFDAKLFAGDPMQQHNRYPELWAQTVRMACEKAGQPDCLAFMRSSFLGSPSQVPMMWAGDQMVDFAPEDGLASVVLGMNSGGVSGSPLWHSDIGGYTSINAVVKNYVRPPNLNARWAELQAFGTLMRTHETNRPAVNQQVYDTEQTRAQFARATQIFAALADYRAGVIEEAVTTGVPAMRHTWLVYPGTKAADADLQFFLGAHLLMAPVTSNDATTVKVSFPPGTWVNVFTGQTFDGDTETEVSAPIGTPAAFVKQGDPVGDQIRASFKAAGLTTG